jgi:hypothetical protein
VIRRLRLLGEFHSADGERVAGDLSGHGVGRGEHTMVDPATDGVVAHPEQLGGTGYAKALHEGILPQMRMLEQEKAASAEVRCSPSIRRLRTPSESPCVRRNGEPGA